MSLQPYHIEQYIEVEHHRVLVSAELLRQFMEWRNREFEEKITYFRNEDLEIVVYYLQKDKNVGNTLYKEALRLLNGALASWERLIKTIRNDRDWDMKLWDDENFRKKFKKEVSWIAGFLDMVNKIVGELLSLLPTRDINKVPSGIQIIMANIPFGFKDAYEFFKEVLEYVEDIERRLEERKKDAGPEEGEERQPVGPVGRAIAAIRSLMQRIFPTRTREEEEVSEHDNENDETTPG
jgi:hypothetical protein